MKFFVWLDERSKGPFDEAAVREMLLNGSVKQETLMCLEDGESGWIPLKDVFPPDLAVKDRANIEKIAPPTKTTDDVSRLHVRLTSGSELKIVAIRLYDEVALTAIASKRSVAMKDLRGVSTGLGAIGSLDWVLTASLAIGAVEGVLSASAAATAKNLLIEAASLEEILRSEGIFKVVGGIKNIEMPVPSLWRVPYSRKARIETGKNFWGEMQFEEQDIASALVHSGDDFFEAQIEDGSSCYLRWASFESYRFQKSG